MSLLLKKVIEEKKGNSAGGTDFLSNAAKSIGNKFEKIVDTAKEDKKLYDKAKKDNEENQKLMDASKEKYLRTEIILTEEARNLDIVKEKILTDFKKIDGKNFLNLRETEIAQQQIQSANEINITSSAAVAGIAGGTLAAGSAVAMVMAFCTAGTGAAISNLTGIFAVKATLAALGGGTLAAGGFGMAGGVVVASTLFAVPAIIGAGLAFHKKIQEFAEQVQTATDKVKKAVKINSELAQRNLDAASNLRKMYDVGISIDFFLKNLQYRIEHAPKKIQADMIKIAFAAREQLIKTFMDFEILTADNKNFNSEFEVNLKAIEDDCQALQNILYSNNGKIFTSRDINPVFQQTYNDAQEFIYMSYPWFNKFKVNEDLELMKAAARRGVKFFIYYGYHDVTENTVEAINILKRELPAGSAKFFKVDSHRKIILCEKYVLYGSQNMMTYRLDDWAKRYEDLREEVTVKVENVDVVNEFKNLVISQVERK